MRLATKSQQPAARGHRTGAGRRRFAQRTVGGANSGPRRLPAHRQGAAPRALRSPRQIPADSGLAVESAPAAAVKLQIQDFLSLPTLAADVPSALDWSSGADGQKALGHIAQALLEEGILREEDWAENLSDSIGKGLTRWAHGNTDGECNAAELKLFGLGMFYADRSERLGPWLHWWPHNNNAFQETFGMFGFTGDYYRNDLPEVCVGATVMKLEEVRKGAGFAVLALIDHACDDLISCATPLWAWQAFEFYGNAWHDERHDYPDENGDVDDDGEESGLLTKDGFFAAIPHAAVQTRWKASMRTTLQRALNSLGAWEREASNEGRVLSMAIRIYDALLVAQRDMATWKGIPAGDYNRMAQCLNQNCWMQTNTDLPEVLIRWSASDPIPRITDDHHECIYESNSIPYIDDDESGEPDALLFVRVFRTDVPPDTVGSLRHAVRGFKYALTLIVQLGELLMLMHSTDKVPPHAGKGSRRKRVKRLAEILGGENDGKEFVSQI